MRRGSSDSDAGGCLGVIVIGCLVAYFCGGDWFGVGVIAALALNWVWAVFIAFLGGVGLAMILRNLK